MANEARFEVYPRHDAGRGGFAPGEGPRPEYGWRFRAANGQITAVGGEGFSRRMDAHRAVRQFLTAAADVIEDFEAPVVCAPILDVDG